MNQLYLELLENNINLYYFDISKKKDILLIFTQFLLQNKSQNNLFTSLTINNNEISIICDSSIENFIDFNDFVVKKNFRCVKIYDTCDNIEQIGIVAKISNILTTINIPILYINSYNNNYVIIENIHITNALQELEKFDFSMI
jgi:hypothetical protein